MSTDLLIGIDVGTHTTVLSAWDINKNHVYEVKHRGQALVPSVLLSTGGKLLFGQVAIERVREEPGLEGKLTREFKIDFWNTPDDRSPPEETCAALRAFVECLYDLLRAEFRDRLARAEFCFTFPAQREGLHEIFKELVCEAGFDPDRVHLLDECSAAGLGVALQSDPDLGVGEALDLSGGRASLWEILHERLPEGSTGLLVDIGAGTTDTAVVEVESEGVKVLATRSTDIAGRDCTLALEALAVEFGRRVKGSPAERWRQMMKQQPQQADRRKESDFSDPYRNPDERAYPRECALARYGIKLSCPSFEAFVDSARPAWEQMSGSVQRAWEDGGDDDQPAWVLLIGGGALHSGIEFLARTEFGPALVDARGARNLTARGAAGHLAPHARLAGAELVGTVEHVMAQEVSVSFPENAGGRHLVLYSKGETVDVSKGLIEETWATKVNSNWFTEEGAVYLQVGSNKTLLGKLDVAWKLFKESNDHPTKIATMLDPGTKMLTVQVVTSNVELHEDVSGQVSVQLKIKGGYDRARQ